ncbi:MAG: PDZ domain-containing protein [Nanoarchaeota archaeon]
MKISFRVIILIIALFISLLAIKPSFEKGVVVKSVNADSSLYEQGLRSGEIISTINREEVRSIDDYARIMENLFADEKERRVDISTKSGEYTLLTNSTLDIKIEKIPSTRIQTGLDLRGGSRALVKPEFSISDGELQDLVETSRNRFNVYGLSDVNIKGVSDLSGEKYMLVEVAGASPEDIEKLIAQQGKFEAKIANQTVFEGGEKDIGDVCRNDASCSSVTSCSPAEGGGFFCNFAFAVYLKEEAAQKHAAITSNLSLDNTGQYLSESIYLYVDDIEVDSLLISSELKGQVATQISIQGSGSGLTREEAIKNTRESMNRLQTILITGSLPYKLSIVKLDTISPLLGRDFVSLILMAGLASIVAVSLIVFVRYRRIKASLALLLTSFSELVIILGVASLIRWNLDLPSIAGILATIGTGVDQQIVIMDEAERSKTLSIKERMKRASFIILSSYFSLVAAMLPLYWAGAGLFKGFALTTIIGITSAILITRPAFADIIKRMELKG